MKSICIGRLYFASPKRLAGILNDSKKYPPIQHAEAFNEIHIESIERPQRLLRAQHVTVTSTQRETNFRTLCNC